MRGYDPLVKLAKLYDIKLITKDRRVKRSYSVPVPFTETFEVTEFTEEGVDDSGTAEEVCESLAVLQEKAEVQSWDGDGCAETIAQPFLIVNFPSENDSFRDSSVETDTSYMDGGGFPDCRTVSLSREPENDSMSSIPMKYPKLRLDLTHVLDHLEVDEWTPKAPSSPELPTPDASLVRKLRRKAAPPSEEKEPIGTEKLEDILSRLNKIGDIESEDSIDDQLDSVMARLANFGSQKEDKSSFEITESSHIISSSHSIMSYRSNLFEVGSLRTLHRPDGSGLRIQVGTYQ